MSGKGAPPTWISAPPSPPKGCPPGLEYLVQVDQVIVKQQTEMLEAITGWETSNKYQILNAAGQQIFFAGEESSCMMRQCGGNARGFIMHISDNQNREVMRVQRDCQCCVGCCCCIRGDTCATKCEVEAPVGMQTARIRQTFSWWKPRLEVLDVDDKPMFKIGGPCCLCQAVCCKGDLDFIITDMNDTTIGKISKKWDGVLRDMFTDADTFGVTFPMDLDVTKKAALIGAVFHVDFLYFEEDKNNNS